MYIKWSFLSQANRADSKTSLILLFLLLPVLAACLFLVAYAGISFTALSLPFIIPMLVPFYLPFALTTEESTAISAKNILFHKNPLETAARPIMRGWVYGLYALLPALALITIIIDSRTAGGFASINPLNEFSYIFIATYTVFLLLALMLGKLRLLKPGRFCLSIAGSLSILLIFRLLT